MQAQVTKCMALILRLQMPKLLSGSPTTHHTYPRYYITEILLLWHKTTKKQPTAVILVTTVTTMHRVSHTVTFYHYLTHTVTLVLLSPVIVFMITVTIVHGSFCGSFLFCGVIKQSAISYCHFAVTI